MRDLDQRVKVCELQNRAIFALNTGVDHFVNDADQHVQKRETGEEDDHEVKPMFVLTFF